MIWLAAVPMQIPGFEREVHALETRITQVALQFPGARAHFANEGRIRAAKGTHQLLASSPHPDGDGGGILRIHPDRHGTVVGFARPRVLSGGCEGR